MNLSFPTRVKFVVWRVGETTPNLSFVPVHFGAKKYGMGRVRLSSVGWVDEGVGGSSQRVAVALHRAVNRVGEDTGFNVTSLFAGGWILAT